MAGPSEEWILKAAEMEDGKCVSVGGLLVKTRQQIISDMAKILASDDADDQERAMAEATLQEAFGWGKMVPVEVVAPIANKLASELARLTTWVADDPKTRPPKNGKPVLVRVTDEWINWSHADYEVVLGFIDNAGNWQLHPDNPSKPIMLRNVIAWRSIE